MAVGVDEKTGGPAGYAAGWAGGWAGWLLARWHGRRRAEPRLALLERITLAPRQSLALIEAEGRRILVATSAEGGPAFYPLDEIASSKASRETQRAPHGRPRVSW
jgi:flagellar biogenesis protein FliO